MQPSRVFFQYRSTHSARDTMVINDTRVHMTSYTSERLFSPTLPNPLACPLNLGMLVRFGGVSGIAKRKGQDKFLSDKLEQFSMDS